MRPDSESNTWLNMLSFGLYKPIAKYFSSINNSITKATRYCVMVCSDVTLSTITIMGLSYLHMTGIFSLGIVPLVMLSFLINGIRGDNNKLINQGVYNVMDFLLPLKELGRGLLRTTGSNNSSSVKQTGVSYIYSAIFVSSYFINTGLFGFSSIFWFLPTTIVPFAIESIMNNSVNGNEFKEVKNEFNETLGPVNQNSVNEHTNKLTQSFTGNFTHRR